MDGMKCSRYLLVFVCIIMFLSGGTLVAAGLMFKLDSGFLDTAVVTLFNTVQYSSLPLGITCEALSYIMMSTGGLMLFVAILGMCAGMKAVRGCLWVFIVLAVIFILLQGVTIGLWLSVRTKADLWLRGKMLDLLKNYAGPEATDSTSNGWNILFMKARCCGVNAQYENGGTNDDFTELPTTWTPSGTDKLPASCCQGASTSTVSTYVSSSTCTQTPSNFYTEGCYSRVKHYIDTYSLVTIIAAGSGIMVEVLAIISACIVIDKKKNRVGDISDQSKPPPYVAIDHVISAKKAAAVMNRH
ncbi:tetraspanin-3-like [Mya arenaria]|uniref:tetraspanin-3-like n=1 Tax=Mya arenaria TaxID=6604 RepID=UPI0022E72FE2|nr:tetraspanin-3-like [Mya arenaria]